MRAALFSAVGASVSFFVPAVDLRPAVQPAVQPVQPAWNPRLENRETAYPVVQPAVQPAVQPVLPLPRYISLEPQEAANPSAGTAADADGGLLWFSYGFFGALVAMAMRSRLQPSVASLATAGQRSTGRVDAIPALRAARTAATRAPRARPRMQLGPPPEGYVWAEDEETATVDKAEASGVAVSAAGTAPKPSVQAVPESAATTESSAAIEKPKPKPKPKPAKRAAWREGIFAPLVLGAKQVMGEQGLKELRASVIAKHSKVIAEFVDTSESEFGQLVLKRMFEYADKDGNGTLDKEEVRAALLDLGFDFNDDKQLEKVMKNADADQNDVIDFEEFVKATPRTLRVNLTKLAKKNGHDLGFLV